MKVLTFGVFDYFHYGHLKLLERAKAFGDHLTVAVQRTEDIRTNKPDAILLYSLEHRMEILKAIRYVDEVVPYSKVPVDIKNIDFDILVVGGDQTNNDMQEAKKWCLANGKIIKYLERTPNICSSEIKKNV